MKEEGGRGNKNNCINVSLRLRIIIHQYIDAQSHLLHTLSLPLSLSPPHPPHTHTTHTLTQSKSGRYELIRFLKVKEMEIGIIIIIIHTCTALSLYRNPQHSPQALHFLCIVIINIHHSHSTISVYY